MKVLIEWLDAVLLSADAYDTYDASIGIQKIQMRLAHDSCLLL